MKKIIYVSAILFFILPKQISSQDSDAVAAGVGALVGVGAAITAIEQIKENLEQKAVEQVLTAYPFLIDFELKSSSLKGTKMKDLSPVGVLTFEIKDIKTNNKYVLFAFTSNGLANQYGSDYNRLLWKNFDSEQLNKLMQNYIKTASGIDLSISELAESKIVNNGTKQGSKFILKFDKIGGDVYLSSDYSDEFKVVFNKKSLGLYLKKHKI